MYDKRKRQKNLCVAMAPNKKLGNAYPTPFLGALSPSRAASVVLLRSPWPVQCLCTTLWLGAQEMVVMLGFLQNGGFWKAQG